MGRSAGVLVIAIVLLAAIIVPRAIAGVDVVGQPVATPVPVPPALGDCLTTPVDQSAVLTVFPGGLSVSKYSPLSLHACSGPRYGEVAAIIASPAPQPHIPSTQHQALSESIDDPNYDRCAAAAVGYVGLATGARKLQFTYWSTQLTFDTALSVPTLRQQSIGQHWVACVIYGPNWDLSAARLPGSLKDALHTGTDRDELGNCILDGTDDLAETGPPCTVPHEREMFGLADWRDPRVSAGDLTRTCTELVQKLTGLADPTAGGRLRVTMDSFSPPVKIASSGATSDGAGLDGTAECSVETVGSRSLDGSLLAIDRSPIPWA